jgi:hypothetical protein
MQFRRSNGFFFGCRRRTDADEGLKSRGAATLDCGGDVDSQVIAGVGAQRVNTERQRRTAWLAMEDTDPAARGRILPFAVNGEWLAELIVSGDGGERKHWAVSRFGDELREGVTDDSDYRNSLLSDNEFVGGR